MARDTNQEGRGLPRARIANEERLIALGEAVNRRERGSSGRTPRTRRRVWIRRSAITIGVVIVLIIGGVAADYFYLGSLINKQNVKHLQSAGATENILLIGSTTRCGLKVQNKAYGLCSQGVTGVNSDIDMIVHLDPSDQNGVTPVDSPRPLHPQRALRRRQQDRRRALPGAQPASGRDRGGLGDSDQSLRRTQLRHLRQRGQRLGGVHMYFPTPIYDAESDLNIERPGCYLLDGRHALQLVRARHLQIQPNPSNHDPHTWPQEALSDLARIRRTHEFLRVLAAKVAARGLGNPLTDQSTSPRQCCRT
jgi:hypothetical protein